MAAMFGGGAVDPETLYTKQSCIGMNRVPREQHIALPKDPLTELRRW